MSRITITKTLTDSSENNFAINKVIVEMGIGRLPSLEIFYRPDQKDAVKQALLGKNIPLQFIRSSSLTVPLENFGDQPKLHAALNQLKEDELISPSFAEQISQQFPNKTTLHERFFSSNRVNASASAAIRIPLTSNHVEQTQEPRSDLEKRLDEQRPKYMEIFSKKIELERTFHNESLDAETRLTAAEELAALFRSSHTLTREYQRNLEALQARLTVEVAVKQAASNHDDSADRSMSFK